MKPKRQKEPGIVYSTAYGRMCPDCCEPVAACICSQKKAVPRGDGIVRVSRETKGRKGKGMTIISGILKNNEDLSTIAKQLKKKCGAGGTVKNGVIEIQGDVRDVVVNELSQQGFTVKKAGG